jgi:ribosomal-protein-alanine N-acetyltransferase
VIADADIGLALPADAAAIAALSRDSIEVGLPWRWTAARVARAIRDRETNVVVVRRGGSLAAFGIMSYRGDEAHLLLLAVRRDCRRSGIGSAVLAWLEGVARVAGIQRIVLEARRDNAAARSFYGVHGYHERFIVPALYSGVVDGVGLVKWLRSPEPTTD